MNNRGVVAFQMASRRLAILAMAGTGLVCVLHAQTFITINEVSITAVSADGSTVVGEHYRGYNQPSYAFRWTEATGLKDLGPLPGGRGSVATAVSSDGSVIVGYADDPLINGNESTFRWTAATGMKDLYYPSPGAQPNAVNADGTVIVGDTGTGSFVWTPSTGMVDISALWFPVVGYFRLFGLSSDGALATGIGDFSNVGWSALLGALDGGVANIGVYNSTVIYGSAGKALSGDGSTVVGYYGGPSFPFVWSLSAGFQQLAAPGPHNGGNGAAWAVNGDGTVAVGNGSSSNGSRALIWINPSTTPANWFDLNTYLPANGVTTPCNGCLLNAVGVSSDGLTIVGGLPSGSGIPAGWYARIPCNHSFCPADLTCDKSVDLSDLSKLLSNYGKSPASPEDGDLTGDHVIDLSDLAIMLSTYGSTCP